MQRNTRPRAHLDGLTMLTEDVDSDDSLPKLWVSGLDGLIVLMLRVAHGVETAEHKLKECLQVFRARGRHKNITVAKKKIL